MLAKKKTKNRPIVSTRSIFEPLEQRRMLSAGDLDPFFGNAGTVTGAVGFTPTDTAIQADGKIVVVGEKSTDFAVARLNTDGTLDRTFGGDGVVTTNFGGKDGDKASAVAIQPDGKIVVVGTRRHDPGSAVLPGESNDDFAIARYNSDGSLDTSFSRNGKTTIGFGEADSARDVAIQPDGKIVVVGRRSNIVDFVLPDPENTFAVARLNPNGSLDSTFGTPAGTSGRSGKITTSFGGGTNEGAEPSAVLIQPDGKIVVGGTSDASRLTRFALARYRADGILDSTFGGDGKLTISVRGNPRLHSLAIQPNGRIIAAGTSEGKFALARLQSDGSVDRSFGADGVVLTGIAGNDAALSVLTTPDNKIIAGGIGGGAQFGLARYNRDGSLDTAFGNGGKVVTGLGGNEAIHTMQLTGDGKLLVAGASSGRAAMARYFHFVPEVNIIRLNTTLKEHDTKDGTFMILRDKREDFTTRVYYTIGGNAYPDADFTIDPGPNQRYVDILPNETFSLVKINTIDDAEVEPTQTVTLQLLPKDHYTVGSRDMASIKIRDNDVLRINFQPDGSPLAPRFLADTGAVFGDRGNGYRYGWDADNSAQTRDRDILTDQRFDTLTHLQKNGANRDWRLAVANGSYNVRVASSDPEFFDGHWRINVEGTLALDHVPTSSAFSADNSMTVNVTGSRLNLTNASGAINNKLAFIELRSSEFVAPPPLKAPGFGVVAPIGSVSGTGGSSSGSGSSGSSGSTTTLPISEFVFSQTPIGGVLP